MNFLTVEQMRTADQTAITALKIPGLTLMRRAGIALAEAAKQLARAYKTSKIVVVSGHGNNGGDACIAARCLHEDGYLTQVLMTCVPAQLRGDAHKAWDEMRTAGVPYTVLATPANWDDLDGLATDLEGRSCVIIDGVLGTGCKEAPADEAASAIRWINAMKPHARIVSADLPSGMNGNTGETPGCVVEADITVTFARPKRCFLNEKNAYCVGHLLVANIGIPDAVSDASAQTEPCALNASPRLLHGNRTQDWDAHKGNQGHICILGGSRMYPHAPILAAAAALKSGAGLVTLTVPEASASAAATLAPEAILNVQALTAEGTLSSALLSSSGWKADAFDILAVGPGLSVCAQTSDVVARLLATASVPMVLDADGLTALANLRNTGEWRPSSNQPLILTPHPGEAARLLGCSVQEVQADRLTAVRRLADLYQAVIVLKGAGTLIAQPGCIPLLNRTGNPGMATAGTGDVLTGMIAALWAQHDQMRTGILDDAFASAAAAVWIHGAAGDFAAFEEGRRSVTATRLLANLPKAYNLATQFSFK